MLRFLTAALAVAALISIKSAVSVSAETTPGAALALDARFSQRLVAAGGERTVFLKVSVKAPALTSAKRRAPLNVALVIDRSGSMQGPKMAAAQDAAVMALEKLSADDIAAVVSYDNVVEIDVPATKATGQAAMINKIRRLTPRGSTAIHAGLVAGAAEVRKFKGQRYVNRIILLSDGLANVGPSTPAAFEALGRKLGGEGIAVSTIGLGTGYNEDLMSRLAMASDGAHAFVQEPADLAAFLAREFDDALSVAAQDLVITIELEAGAKPLRSLGREAEIKGQTITYRVGQISAGTEQVLLSEVALPAELGAENRAIAAVRLSYRPAGGNSQANASARADIARAPTPAEAEASVDRDVMRDAALLEARTARDEAIRLRDAGRLEEAQRQFQATSQGLIGSAAKYGFQNDARVRAEASASAAAAAPSVSAQEWNTQRKVLRGQDANQPGANSRY